MFAFTTADDAEPSPRISLLAADGLEGPLHQRVDAPHAERVAQQNRPGVRGRRGGENQGKHTCKSKSGEGGMTTNSICNATASTSLQATAQSTNRGNQLGSFTGNRAIPIG